MFNIKDLFNYISFLKFLFFKSLFYNEFYSLDYIMYIYIIFTIFKNFIQNHIVI